MYHHISESKSGKEEDSSFIGIIQDNIPIETKGNIFKRTATPCK